MPVLLKIILTVLILFGSCTCFLFTSFQFLGLIAFGLTGLIAIFYLLILLKKRSRKAANCMIILLSAILAIGLAAACITGFIISRSMVGNPETNCEYIVVLGAGVNGTEPSLSLQERIDAAYDYLSAHPDTVCIVSGAKGGGEDITEAECMRRELTGLGIDPNRIWMEEKATNTRENLKFSLDLIEANSGTRPTSIGLISSDYHMYRASLFAREQNVAAVCIPAHTGWISLRVNYFLREIVAVWYYITFGGL